MRYCPACGAPAKKGDVICAHCGSPLPAEKKRSGSPDRKLHLAIAAVAVLWVLTAGLWMLWPRLSQAAPSAQEHAKGALSGGLRPAPSASAAPSEEPSPSPAPASAPEPTATVTALPQPSAAPTPAAGSAPSPANSAESLELYSWWWGYLFLENFRGDNPLGKDVVQVWGYIGYTSGDRAFFELYDQRDVTDETSPLLSYYVELYDDHLVPVIGKRDAWVLDRFLDQSDVEPLTLYLRDGNLKLSYHYEAEGQSCDLFCMLVPDS